MFGIALKLLGKHKFKLIGIVFSVIVIVGSLCLSYRDGFEDGVNQEVIKFKEFQIKKEKEINELSEKANKVETVVVTEYVDRVQTVVENKYIYRDVIREIPSACPSLTYGWIETYNASVTNTEIPEGIDLSAPSNVSDNEALEVIVENNAIALSDREKLIALQTWVDENYVLINGEER